MPDPEGVDGRERGASIEEVGASPTDAETAIDPYPQLPRFHELALQAESALCLPQTRLGGLARRALG